MADFFPQPIPPSGALRGPHNHQTRESTDDVPAPRPHNDRPLPYPSDPRNLVHDDDAPSAATPGTSILSGSAMDDFVVSEGVGRSTGLQGSAQASRRGQARRHGSGRNYGSAARIGALLEHGTALPIPTPSASSSVLSRPSLNSSISRQRRIIDAAASAKIPDDEVEKRVREEIKRMQISGREHLEQGNMETVEASLALEASRVNEGLGADEMFRDLMPITQDVKQVLKAKVVKKQVDPKWQSTLALKPAMDLFDDDFPDRQVRGFSLPPLPPLADARPSLSASCGPMLIRSYTKHLDFQWHDLREIPDGILDVDSLCPKPSPVHPP